MQAFAEGDLLAGQFKIQRQIGEGGMATVYRALDERHGRSVAVKVLRSGLRSETAAARFHQEVEIAARLNHPHVLPLLTSGEHEGRLYFVMPYVDGPTLREQLDQDVHLPLADALRFASEVADGLQYAHSEGVVHRDIKPDNLFLVDGHAVIADFGIARALHTDRPRDLTQFGAVVGTPRYMSPEQALDGLADERSDIYALGCVLYQMLVGKPPLLAATPLSMFARRETQSPPSITKVRADAPPSLDAILGRTLAPDPDDRYQSAAELREDLKDLSGELRSGGGSQGQTTGTWTTTPNGPDHRDGSYVGKVVRGAALVAALGVAALAFDRFQDPEVGPARSIAVLAFDNLDGQTEDDAYFVYGVAQSVRDALSRHEELRVASRESSVNATQADADPAGIADRLDVDAVVEGAIARTADSVRINVRVIDIRTDRQSWGATLTGSTGDIFALQDAIADSVVRAIGLLSATDTTNRERTRRTDVVTHNMYLQGRFAAADRTPDALRRATDLFREAIERDSTYAPAWANLASAHALAAVYEYQSWEDLRPEAEHAAAEAIRLDDRLPEAHTARGVLLDYEFRWDEAQAAYLRALDLNPNDAQAYHWYAVSRVLAGQPEQGAGLIEQARHLNPLSFTIAVATGWVHYYRRDLATAINRLELALDLEPNAWVAYQYLGLAYSDQGRHAEAIVALERAQELNPSAPSLLPGLARAHALAGDTVTARTLLDEAAQRGAPASWLAIGQLALGRTDQALAILQSARDAGSWNVIELNTFWFDALRDHPPFAQLVAEVHSESQA